MGSRTTRWLLAALAASILIHLLVLGLPGWALPDPTGVASDRIDVALVARPVDTPPPPRRAVKAKPKTPAVTPPPATRSTSTGIGPAVPPEVTNAPAPPALPPPAAGATPAEPQIPVAEAHSNGPEWPRGGRILYDVFYGNRDFLVGRTEHIWEQDGQRYRMTSLVETVGLTALLHNLRYAQHSEGRLTADGLRPDRFWVDQSGKAEESADFDWETGEATVHRHRGAPRHAALKPGDQDVLSIWHQLALLGDPPPHLRLTLVSNKAATPAVIEAVGVDQVDLPIGSLRAHHLRARAEDGSLTLDLWLAEKFAYLPVRIVVVDRDGDTFDQRARSIVLDPPPPRRPSTQVPQ